MQTPMFALNVIGLWETVSISIILLVAMGMNYDCLRFLPSTKD